MTRLCLIYVWVQVSSTGLAYGGFSIYTREFISLALSLFTSPPSLAEPSLSPRRTRVLEQRKLAWRQWQSQEGALGLSGDGEQDPWGTGPVGTGPGPSLSSVVQSATGLQQSLEEAGSI